MAVKKDIIQIAQHLETSTIVQKELKEEAYAAYKNSELPTTRNEKWKYTRVAKLNKLDFRSSNPIGSIVPEKLVENSFRIVFINGFYHHELSDSTPEDGIGIQVLSGSNDPLQSTSLELTNVFNALNLAFLTDGIRINVAKKTKAKQTIEIVHILDGDAVISNFKSIVEIDDLAELNLVQYYTSTEKSVESFCNVTSEFTLGVNASMKLDKIQDENDKCYHIESENVHQNKDSHFSINTITLNGRLVRNNLNVLVNGDNCTTDLYGVYLLKGDQHVDNQTVIDHKVAHCNSNELYKGVIDDKGTAVFNGKVFVRKDAQKINAFQSNGNVLLSENATINSKPELEIYADDVKCSHGSTTGQLDKDAIFYLRARGLSEKGARQLLVRAFVSDALVNIHNQEIHDFIDTILETRFGWAKN